MEESYEAPSEAFLAAIGSLTLNWAAIETALDFAIATIFFRLQYPKMDKAVPQALSRKIEFVCKAVKYRDELAPIRDNALQLLSEIRQRKDDRHKIIHGAILGAPSCDEIQSLRISYTERGHRLRLETVTTAEIDRYSALALPLSDRTTALAIKIFNIAHSEEAIDYPLGEFAT